MRLFIILSTIVALMSCAESDKKEQNTSINWTPFTWLVQDVDDVVIEKMGVTIPLKMESFDYTFKAKLSLGDENNYIDDNVINSIINDNPSFINTMKFISSENDSMDYIAIQDVVLQSSNYSVRTNVVIDKSLSYQDSSILLIQNDTVLLGTLGASFIKNKILVFDLKKQQYTILDSILPQYKDDTKYTNMLSLNSQLIVPLIIDGNIRNVILDTRSSFFDFMTTKNNWDNWIDSSNLQLDYVSFNFVGSNFKAYSGNSNIRISLGNSEIKNTVHKIHYPVKNYIEEYLNSYNAVAVVGLNFFEGRIVVFDFSKNKLGVF